MRIISGTKKGMAVKAVPGKTTRPTTDKVRESLFHIIGPYFEGGEMLDLYGGSGVVGLEAISRGFSKVVFVDKDPKAVKIINENVEALGFRLQTEVYRNDAGRALKAVVRKEKKFDFIFLDPPYEKQKINLELDLIDEAALLKKNGIIVAEHKKEIELNDSFKNFSLWRSEVYGITKMSIFKGRYI
ncbi:16S rRNA (guanine(966)-N(2))-methyltransferase RsmD [Alkalicoccus daliensis]|uniref:16S rRNA (Guanine(966)-N(2))-methyltransferase RsmD n=1 Tax=Alkalicoccus daliensis TaxID=745820 RepID=A0A1G9ZUY1_9BACI|nr:16S rRNA (guanine(966)-N(2))-methyltransferase RsmD [Alkalicoccus daliensis]SDN24463.1 16S rRNA (guanine(966)-N(2))-methyltransferase RsmD [Alkalicoccus daliensis]